MKIMRARDEATNVSADMAQRNRRVLAGVRKASSLPRFLSLLVILLPILVGCRPQRDGSELTVAGSTTILPIVQAAGEEFESKFPGIRVLVQGGGSSAGIEAVSTEAADIGTSSRDLTEEEAKLNLSQFVIATDAIAVIVNPKNPVNGLDSEELRGIFTGKITNWRRVGGRNSPIILVNRDEASGTREAFAKAVLAGSDFTKDAVIQPGSGQVRAIVMGTPDAIGYISLGYVTDKVKPLRFNGITPTVQNIKAGEYGLQRKLRLLTKSRPSRLSKKFVDFVLSPEIQEKIVGVEFVPVR